MVRQSPPTRFGLPADTLAQDGVLSISEWRRASIRDPSLIKAVTDLFGGIFKQNDRTFVSLMPTDDDR